MRQLNTVCTKRIEKFKKIISNCDNKVHVILTPDVVNHLFEFIRKWQVNESLKKIQHSKKYIHQFNVYTYFCFRASRRESFVRRTRTAGHPKNRSLTSLSPCFTATTVITNSIRSNGFVLRTSYACPRFHHDWQSLFVGTNNTRPWSRFW